FHSRLSVTAHPPLPLTLLFLFHCHGPHRYLHSFPTRRSSDLVGYYVPPPAAGRDVPQTNDVFVDRRGLVFAIDRDEGLSVLEFADRKSTRLNSSHGSISYAVFCLKKKKKKNSNTQSDDVSHYH